MPEAHRQAKGSIPMLSMLLLKSPALDEGKRMPLVRGEGFAQASAWQRITA